MTHTIHYLGGFYSTVDPEIDHWPRSADKKALETYFLNQLLNLSNVFLHEHNVFGQSDSKTVLLTDSCLSCFLPAFLTGLKWLGLCVMSRTSM